MTSTGVMNNNSKIGASSANFDIRNHIDQLTPNKKQKGKYICPACNSHNLSINRVTGAYTCYSCYDSLKIKQILTAVEQKEREEKTPRQKKTTHYDYPDRQGNPLIRVIRIDDGLGKKQIFQQHWNGQAWVKGYGPVKTQDIPLYRYAEVMDAIALGQPIVLAEGESTVDAFWDKGIPATTTIGGTGKTVIKDKDGNVRRNDKTFESIKPALADLTGSVIVSPDQDKPGCLHMEMMAEILNVKGWLYPLPDSFQWSRLPNKGGLDFVDWIHDYPSLTTEEILSHVQPEPIHVQDPMNSSPLRKNAQVLKLVKEYIESDRTEEELVLDLEDLREKMGIKPYKWKEITASTMRTARKTRYRLELKRLLTIEDPLDLSLDIDEVCQIYRKRRGTVQSDMAKMEAKTYTEDKVGPKLAIEYDRVDVQPRTYLIPDFLPGNSTSILLSGLSGTAKTQFMLDMAESLLEGQEFLGLKPSSKCKILLLITDQTKEQSLAYLRNKGIDLTNPNLALWLKDGDDPGFTINNLLALRQFIEDFRPDFIGADSLRTIVTQPAGISENDAEVGGYLNKVIQEATRFGSTFLMIHHENKSTELKGVSKSSGSGDIPARFDIHWRLEKPLETSERRIFSTAKTRSSSRNGHVILNPDECRFELERWEMESPEFSKTLSSTVSRIDHLLTINPQGLAIWDIESMMAQGGTPVSIRTVRRCLAQMTASQSIGRKQHPTRQRAFLYYKLQPDDGEEIFSSDTSHLPCHNNSNPTETPNTQAQSTVSPTVTSPVTPNDSIVSATTVSPQNQDKCHTNEAFVESSFEPKSDNGDTENLSQKKMYPENVVQNEISEEDTTQSEDAVPTEDDRSLGQPSLADDGHLTILRKPQNACPQPSAGSDRLQYFVPGAIQVGDRVKVLVGLIEDRLGTVAAIDPKRILAPYHIHFDNGGAADEPLYNLARLERCRKERI